jgi:hypothetical protein
MLELFRLRRGAGATGSSPVIAEDCPGIDGRRCRPSGRGSAVPRVMPTEVEGCAHEAESRVAFGAPLRARCMGAVAGRMRPPVPAPPVDRLNREPARIVLFVDQLTARDSARTVTGSGRGPNRRAHADSETKTSKYY